MLNCPEPGAPLWHDPHVCSGDTLANNPYVRRHVRSYHGGVLADEVRELIARYHPTLLHRLCQS